MKADFTTTPVGSRISDFGKVDFDASVSSDASAKITDYHWTWGDTSEDNIGVPAARHNYVRGGDYNVTMQFTDAENNVSGAATNTVKLCERGPIPVTLPAVNVSLTDLAKLVRVGYGELPLVFSYTEPPQDATCSFSGTGTLPVSVGLAVLPDIRVDSVATAKLDFLREQAPVPDCRWAIPNRGNSIAENCVVGGSGDTLVRWTTPGFSERLAGVQIFNSGSLTYYARVASTNTYAQAIDIIETLLHVELSQHLGWIHWFYMIQEPPADIRVVDSAGRTTGRQTLGGTVVQDIPASIYSSNGAGAAAVMLLNPPASAFRIDMLGVPGERFSLSVAKIFPVMDTTGSATETRISAKLPVSGVLSLTCPGATCVLGSVSPWPIVKRGAVQHPVQTLQYLLRARGHRVTVDGIFGPNTENAVRAFQREKDLSVDGIIGPNTWSALIVPVEQGSQGDAVRGVQEEFQFRHRLGDQSKGLQVDGIFGPKTDAAVRGFQQALHADIPSVTVDGIVGPITWRALVSGDAVLLMAP